MKIDFERFKGSLPYASELFGIYQPLLGWKSKMTEDRMARSQDSVIRNFSERAISRTPSDVNVQAIRNGFNVTKLKVLDILSSRFLPRIGTEINSIIARVTGDQLPADRKPTPRQWLALLNPQVLNKQLRISKDWIESVLTQNSAAIAAIPPQI